LSVVEKVYTTQRYFVRLSIEEEDDDLRIDQFIQTHLTSFSREEIKRRIQAGHILIEGRPHKLKSSTRVRFGEVVALTIPRTNQEDEYWRGQKLALQETPDIVYEDDDLIAISKPAYMATHPTGKHIFNCATVFFETIHQHTIHSLHRLDRETSGVLLLSKNPKMAAEITDQFERDQVKKVYFFIAKFKAPPEKLEFTATERLGPLELGLKRIHIHAFPADSELGKSATTHFTIVEQFGNYALGLAFPQTGRQHQIRVHAMTHGLPLLGDKIYLGSFKMFQRFKDGLATEEDHDLMEIPRHALHALALQCTYKGQPQTFVTQIPHDLAQWIEQNSALNIIELNQKLKGLVQAYFRERR
jgi:23S rRNA pseudouridine1911/1915/1917 synthase